MDHTVHLLSGGEVEHEARHEDAPLIGPEVLLDQAVRRAGWNPATRLCHAPCISRGCPLYKDQSCSRAASRLSSPEGLKVRDTFVGDGERAGTGAAAGAFDVTGAGAGAGAVTGAAGTGVTG